MKLSDSEIRRRLIEWRNLKKLHRAAREQGEKLSRENRELKDRIQILAARDREKDATIADLKRQIEELQTIIFGKKNQRRKPRVVADVPEQDSHEKPERPSASYQRTLPTPEQITHRTRREINACPLCQTNLTHKKTRSYIEEDIPLPVEKTVTEHRVETGWCASCRKRVNACPLPPSPIILGENVRLYVTYLSVIARLSYTQIQELLKDVYAFHVSEGEIAAILTREAQLLRLEQERLLRRIRDGTGVHMDETGWKLFLSHSFRRHAWSMSSTESTDTVFAVARGRGIGVARELYGESTAVLVSDDYGAYRNLSQHHQLCWAHPLRKLRDLAQSTAFDEQKRKHCERLYDEFRAIYRDLSESLEQSEPARHYSVLHERLLQMSAAHARDPAPLARIKKRLARNVSRYLTCLEHPGIPPDNNKAERALRHVVLKRKVSFGSLTEKGAKTLEVLLSVLLSLKWKSPDNFFEAYRAVRGV